MKNRPVSSWIGNAVGIIMAIYICVLLAGVVKRNYELSQEIDTMQSQINALQSQKAQLTFDVSYYQTSSYQQREAKAKLGLEEPGETEIVLPPQPTPSTSSNQKVSPKLSNFQQWINFLSGKD